MAAVNPQSGCSALPEVAHGLCHFHYLREADMLIYEADRHAKKEERKSEEFLNVPLTTQMSQSQKLCRAIVKRCAIALTDDGRPPLDASGLRLQQRLNAIEQSLERVAQKGLPCLSQTQTRNCLTFANYLALDPDYYCSITGCIKATLLKNEAQLDGDVCFRGLLGQWHNGKHR